MHGFQQGAQFQQHVHQQPSIQPASQTVGQFGGYFSDTVQQQLAYSQQYGVRYLPPQQLHDANPQQQQPYLAPQSGQFTGESQGIYMHMQVNVLLAHTTVITVTSFGVDVFTCCFFWPSNLLHVDPLMHILKCNVTIFCLPCWALLVFCSQPSYSLYKTSIESTKYIIFYRPH